MLRNSRPAAACAQVADVDDADLDGELLDALRELSFMQDDVQQQRLDRIESLPEAQLKPALRSLLNSLSKDQLEELAASSSEDEEDWDEVEDGTGTMRAIADHPPEGMRVVSLSVTEQRCFKGHALSPMLARPLDYADQGGPEEFVCDICGIEDQRYVDGVYHCSECGEWDACVRCAGGINSANYVPIELIPACVRAVPESTTGTGDRQAGQRKVQRTRGSGGKRRGKKNQKPGGRRGKKR